MLNDVRIGKKLGIGFGAATALLVLVSAVATIGLMTAAGGFDRYRETARDAVLLGRVQANLLEARLAVRKYMQSDDPALIGEFNERFGKAGEIFAEADKVIHEPQARAKLDEMRGGFATYAKGVSDLKQLTDERVATVKRLAKLGDTFIANLDVIREGVERGGNAAAAGAVGELSERLLLSRLNTLYFIGNLDPASIDKVPGLLGDAFAADLATVRQAVTDGELLRRLDQVQKDSAGVCDGRRGHQEDGPGAQHHRRRRARQGGKSDDRGGRGASSSSSRASRTRSGPRSNPPTGRPSSSRSAWPCSG